MNFLHRNIYEEARLRASPRHGGTMSYFFVVVVRRGGVPSGAAAFIITR